MKVYQSGVATHEWLVSTARKGKVTPKGAWTAKWLSKNHKSSRYNNAPMPYSIFYNGNFAVHGTDQVDRLGSPASAGCIRLHPKNAAVLFALVNAAGLKNTTISVVNLIINFRLFLTYFLVIFSGQIVTGKLFHVFASQ